MSKRHVRSRGKVSPPPAKGPFPRSLPEPKRSKAKERSTSPVSLGRIAAEAAAAAFGAVFEKRRPPKSDVDGVLRRRRFLNPSEQQLIRRSVDSLFRWWGWIEPLRLEPIEARLLLAILLDERQVPRPCRAWAARLGIQADSLVGIGGAPDWATTATMFRRLIGQPEANTNPWTLFPDWLPEALGAPQRSRSERQRVAERLYRLQRGPEALSEQDEEPPRSVSEIDRLGETNLRPSDAEDANAGPTRSEESNASDPPGSPPALVSMRWPELVAAVCDPDPGDRWLLRGLGIGAVAARFAESMEETGTLIVAPASTPADSKPKRSRSSKYSNITIRSEEKSAKERPQSFEGVLVKPASSAIGRWWREPALRWLDLESEPIALIRNQADWLATYAPTVRVGGSLLYAVETVAAEETERLIQLFLENHPAFERDPFPEPVSERIQPGTWTVWPGCGLDTAGFLARLIRTR